MSLLFFYSPNTARTIDAQGADGLGLHTKMSKDDLEAEYGLLITLSSKDVIDRKASDVLNKMKGVSQIDAAEYHGALCCLPPVRWCRFSGDESFLLSEEYTYDVRYAYVRIGGDFFKLMANGNSTHNQLVDEVSDALAAGAVKPNVVPGQKECSA